MESSLKDSDIEVFSSMEQGRSRRRANMAPPNSTISAGRRTRNQALSQSELKQMASHALKENTHSSFLMPNRTETNRKWNLSVVEFDAEVENRCAQIETEGKRAAMALDQILGVWKLQLPPMVRKMPFQEFSKSHKCDVNAALNAATEEVVTPLVTPSARRSMRLAGKHAPRTVTKTLNDSKPTPSVLSDQLPTSSSLSQNNYSKEDIGRITNTLLTQMMSGSEGEKFKLDLIESLKQQLSLVESSLTASKVS